MPNKITAVPVEEALEVVDQYVKSAELLGTKSSAKRTLSGVTEYTSDKIREIVARQYSGYTNREIGEFLGKSPRHVEMLQSKYPIAFDEARADHVTRVFHEYARNIKVVAAALSTTGLAAVRTLGELMRDRDAPPSVRLKAAVNALNMMSFGKTTKEKAAEDHVKVSIVNEIQGIMADPANREAITIEAEDAEVVDGD